MVHRLWGSRLRAGDTAPICSTGWKANPVNLAVLHTVLLHLGAMRSALSIYRLQAWNFLSTSLGSDVLDIYFFSSAFSCQSYSIWFLSLKEFPKFQKYEWHSFVFPCDVTGTFILILKRFSVGEDTDICAHFSPQTIKIPRQQNCMLNKVFQPQLKICSQYNHGQFLS